MPLKHNTQMQKAALLYAYGELPEESEQAFLEHLKTCPHCQKIIYASSLFNAALPKVEAPQYLAIPQGKPAQVKKSWFTFPNLSFKFRLLAPAGAAAIIAVMFLGIYETANLYSHKKAVKAELTENIDTMYDNLYNLEDEVEDIINYIDNL